MPKSKPALLRIQFLLTPLILAWSTHLVVAEEPIPAYFISQAPKNIAEIKAMEKQIQSVTEKVSPATVSVSGGSGVVVSEDGYILTVGHVGQRAGRNVTVTFPDGRKVRAKTLGNNSGIDGGMMKITEEGKYPFVALGNSGELIDGQWCMAVGFPVSFNKGSAPAIRLGRVLNSNDRTIVSDCVIMGGDSGGPLFDLKGNLIGINSRVTGQLNGNVHVPVDSFRKDWDRYAKSDDWNDRRRGNGSRVYIGINVDADRGDGELKISRVVADSPADNAGLEVGDVLVKFDGKAVQSLLDIKKLIVGKKPGDKIKIIYQRDDKDETIDLVLKGRN